MSKAKPLLSGWLIWNKSFWGKNEKCLGKIEAEKKENPVILSSRRHVTPFGTVSPHFGFSGLLPQLWWRDHLALSVPWGLWAFSAWAVSCWFCHHPNHREQILHSWQSLDPLEMSLLHIKGWAPAKGLLDLQVESTLKRNCTGIRHENIRSRCSWITTNVANRWWFMMLPFHTCLWAFERAVSLWDDAVSWCH